MAYIKIFGIKSTVKKAVDYITNPDKTDEQNLVSSYGCSPETADLEFAMTAKLGKDNVMEKGDNLAWHVIISFKPGEITDPNVAHEVATKIADATLKGKHEYVLSTHVDKDHVHCHLIFNATNFVDYHKYVSNKRNYHKICKLSNRICREYSLEESMPTGQKAKSYKENMEYKRGNSWKAKLKYNVDRAIWSSVSFDEFLMKMKEAAKTFSYLSQHNLLNYEEFQNHISDLEASIQAADNQIRQTQQAIQNQKVIKKHCEVYRACRDVVRAEKDAPDKSLYRKRHQAEYQLHDVTLKELAELGIHKLPSSEKLQRQQLELEEELASAKKEKQDLQKQQKALQIIEHNFDAMIREADIKVPEKEPSPKTQEDILS